MKRSVGKIFLVGFGPGHEEHITGRARAALVESDVVVGYQTYVELIQPLLTTQEIVCTGMTEEVSRAQEAVRLAEAGKKVAVISSGDAGVYGMAGLVYEVLIEQGWQPETGIEVEVIPGISAIHSCASLLGAPVMHDACTISLSDHLTPWEVIAKRIEAAAMADFVIALYNPRSGRRTRQIVETQKILLKYRVPETPVGLVKSAYRKRQQIVLTTLSQMLEHEIGMLTTVLIGNASTFIYGDRMITPRGYQRKYSLDRVEQVLKPHERLRPEAEPWALSFTPPAQPTEEKATPLALAEEALARLQASRTSTDRLLLEVAVSAGLAEKKMAAEQLRCLAEVAEGQGKIEYTPDHRLVLTVSTAHPERVVERLRETGLLVEPVGKVVQLKACDFCDGDKGESLPQLQELQKRIGGLEVPKELKIGFNGCAMACYGAVTEDIGIVYRRGKYDLFFGGKKIGRNAQVAKRVAEGLDPDRLVAVVEQTVRSYQEQAYPNERFHKFFQRVGEIAGFRYTEEKVAIESLACGD